MSGRQRCQQGFRIFRHERGEVLTRPNFPIKLFLYNFLYIKTMYNHVRELEIRVLDDHPDSVPNALAALLCSEFETDPADDRSCSKHAEA